MDSVKLDPQLGLALSLPAAERARGGELAVGYDEASDTWELIVQYIGTLEDIANTLLLSVVYLTGDYAIVRIEESRIGMLLALPQIAYVEKPRQLSFEAQMQSRRTGNRPEMEGFRASCIRTVRDMPYALTGRGTILCIVDSGIDYMHPDFVREDGTSKLIGLWDQTIPGNPPEGFVLGSFYDKAQLEAAVATGTRAAAAAIVPSVDARGHGTHVAGIATTIAPEAELLIIKLGNRIVQDVPRTTELIQAVTFARRFADRENRPISINLSYGNNYGAHDGTALVERYLDSIAATARMSICVGTGNEGATARHASLQLENETVQTVEWTVAPYETSINLQVWNSLADALAFWLIAPSGQRFGVFGQNQFTQYRTGGTRVDIYQGVPTPYNQSQQLLLAFVPEEHVIDAGIWRLEVQSRNPVRGHVEFYLPVAEATSSATGFLRPDVTGTLTIPSAASRVIAVAAYNSMTMSQVAFSGRGFSKSDLVKPDLAAPGVDINAAAVGGGYSLRTGTSMATPFVAAGAALLMQWGIVDGNDPYLYGEKLRAYLIEGAKRLPGFFVWPNPILGFGTLCVADSIPRGNR